MNLDNFFPFRSKINPFVHVDDTELLIHKILKFSKQITYRKFKNHQIFEFGIELDFQKVHISIMQYSHLQVFQNIRINLQLLMYRDFIVKQTSKFDSEYKTKTLIGNWYQERCNPNNAYSEFYRQRKLVDPSVTFHQERFQKTTDNPINFQPYNPKETFNTEYRQNYLELQNQKRLSVLKPFITKQSQFDKNKQALDEYREKWTKSKHIYDKSRTYLGVEKKN